MELVFRGMTQQFESHKNVTKLPYIRCERFLAAVMLIVLRGYIDAKGINKLQKNSTDTTVLSFDRAHPCSGCFMFYGLFPKVLFQRFYVLFLQILLQCFRLVCAFPGEVGIFTAEVTVGSGLAVNGTAQIESLDDRGGTEVEVFCNDLRKTIV